ncbi:MAG: hypothetical protein WEC75_11160 [Dehalococcoidia bacterium]
MDVANDLRTVTISSSDSRTVEGVARVRRIDARARGRGLVIEQHEPIAVVVHEAGSVRRIALPQASGESFGAAIVAAPLVYFALRLLMRRSK